MQNKIFVSFDKENESYAFKVKTEYREKAFFNDKEITGNTVLVTKEKPYEIKVLKTTDAVDYYESELGTLSKEQYDSKIQELTINGEKNYSGWYFNNLDEEYAYKKFVSTYNTVYKQEFTWTNYDIEIVEKPVSEYSEIILFTSLDDIKIASDTQAIYKPNEVKWFREFCIKKGLKEVERSEKNTQTFSIPTHSGIRYAQIAGVYVCNDRESVFTGSQSNYNTCVELLKEHKERVEQIVNLGFLRAFPEPLNSVSTADFLNFCINIYSRVEKLNVTKGSIDLKRNALKYITEVKEKVSKSQK